MKNLQAKTSRAKLILSADAHAAYRHRLRLPARPAPQVAILRRVAVVAKEYQSCYNASMKKKVILRDGVFVHEADVLCRELEQAGVPFELCQVSKDGAGIVESHRNNWSTALGTVVNYFNQGGLGVYLRILVLPEDLDRANAVLAPKPRARHRINFVFWGIVIFFVFLFLFYRDIQKRRDIQMRERYGIGNGHVVEE